MIRNAVIGDRVQVINPDGTPTNKGKQSQSDSTGKILGEWDYSLGNTGTVVAIRFHGRQYHRRLTVEPDLPNFGQFVWFAPSQLRRYNEAA